MNILPKKRWHVRTKENIARVRKDEAEAAEKEKQELLRIENADREARLNVLKNKSKQKLFKLGIETTEKEQESTTPQHINLFTDIDHAVKSTNKEHDLEAKKKNEEYEKKIGYLTYLGQDTNESLKIKNWYEVSPSSRFSGSVAVKDTYDKLVLKDQDGIPRQKERDIYNGELDWKLKQAHDPINKFKKYCKGEVKTKSKHKATDITSINIDQNNKKDKHASSVIEKESKLLKLREARLKREQAEKYKTEMFLSGLNKLNDKKEDNKKSFTTIKPKYNSQFNPEFARQNYR